MRERIQGVIVVAIVVLVSLTFVLWGIQYYLQSDNGGSGDVVAKIGGTKIFRRQFDIAYRAAKQRLSDTKAEFNSSDLKRKILSQLITTQAVSQNIEEMGFNINLGQVGFVLKRLPIFQRNGIFSMNRFNKYLYQMQYTRQQFIANLRNNLLINQFQIGVKSTSFVLPDELNNIVKLMDQRRNIRYVAILSSKFLPVKISKKEISDYYKAHEKEFFTKEKVSIYYVELDSKRLAKKIRVSMKEVRSYYEDNINLYTQPERWYISRKQQSESTKEFTKPIWVIKTELSSNIVNILESLKPGQTSKPFKTENGTYIVKLIKSRPQKTTSFRAVENQIKKLLLNQKVSNVFDNKMNELSNLSYTNSNNLKVVSKELGLPMHSSSLFTKSGEKTGILSNKSVVLAAFSDSVLNQKYNSDLITIKPGQIVVLRLKEYKPSRILSLEEAKPAIEQVLKSKKVAEKTLLLGQKIVKEIQNKRDVNSLLRSHKLHWKSASISASSKDFKLPIMLTAFSLPIPQKNSPSVGEVVLNKRGDCAIVWVKSVAFGSTKGMSKKHLDDLKNRLALFFGETDYNNYEEEVVNNSKIKIFNNNN